MRRRPWNIEGDIQEAFEKEHNIQYIEDFKGKFNSGNIPWKITAIRFYKKNRIELFTLKELEQEQQQEETK